MAGQRWPDDIRQQALALAMVDGVKLASDVTQVPERTVREWVRNGNSRQAGDADSQAPDQAVSPVAPVGSLPIPEVKGAALPATGDPARELARDLALARRVYRLQAERFLDNLATSATYRDASVALGIMEDKASKRGLPGSRGGDFSWAANRAEAEGNIPLLRQWLAAIQERLSRG